MPVQPLPEAGHDSWGLLRLGVEGDKEREQEEAARRYLDEHGVWPDEDPHRV